LRTDDSQILTSGGEGSKIKKIWSFGEGEISLWGGSFSREIKREGEDHVTQQLSDATITKTRKGIQEAR